MARGDAVAALGPLTRVTSTAAGDVVVFGLPRAAFASIAQSLEDWRGRNLVDATHSLALGLTSLVVGTTTSGAGELAKLEQGARVPKAFNSNWAGHTANFADPDGKPFMPVFGDDIRDPTLDGSGDADRLRGGRRGTARRCGLT